MKHQQCIKQQVNIPVATGPIATSTIEQMMQLLLQLTVGNGGTFDEALKQYNHISIKTYYLYSTPTDVTQKYRLLYTEFTYHNIPLGCQQIILLCNLTFWQQNPMEPITYYL